MSDYQVRQLENTIAELKEELAMFKERCLQQERMIHMLESFERQSFYKPTGYIECQN